MGNRDFSDATKFETVKNNLEKYNGEIHCELCNKKLLSISECHFDHIKAYAKGGKSTADNCQILCVECNLKKNDKELKDFVLEEKAKRFLEGKTINFQENNKHMEYKSDTQNEMTKETFDKIVGDFITEKGCIHSVDFRREYNHLPSIHYVRKYYGDLNNLMIEFGVEDKSLNWNRENIKKSLNNFISENGTITQKDLTKTNKMPSLPCILNYYPECKNFSDVKRELCNLEVLDLWAKENAVLAGKNFIENDKKLTQRDLTAKNHLPTSKVIYRLFGSMENYQRAVGAEVSKRNDPVTEKEIDIAVKEFFKDSKRVIESQKIFLEKFKYSQSTILKRYGTFGNFCKSFEIKVLKTKKSKYSKREVDDAISAWIKAGNDIPNSKNLFSLGLPSRDVILKYYEDWKEPFYLYKKLYEEINRN